MATWLTIAVEWGEIHIYTYKHWHDANKFAQVQHNTTQCGRKNAHRNKWQVHLFYLLLTATDISLTVRDVYTQSYHLLPVRFVNGHVIITSYLLTNHKHIRTCMHLNIWEWIFTDNNKHAGGLFEFGWRGVGRVVRSHFLFRSNFCFKGKSSLNIDSSTFFYCVCVCVYLGARF